MQLDVRVCGCCYCMDEETEAWSRQSSEMWGILVVEDEWTKGHQEEMRGKHPHRNLNWSCKRRSCSTADS